jgi:hypothetical protein
MCHTAAATAFRKLAALRLPAANSAPMSYATASGAYRTLAAILLLAATAAAMSHASAAALVPFDATLDSTEQGHGLVGEFVGLDASPF